MADLSGQTLGNYTLGERIGRGGMADVYRARQESMDRDVAVKVMAESLAANPEFLARFEREARVIARLQHPHILPVIDFGRSGDYVYLVMRLIGGGSLAERLESGPFTLRQVDRLLSQIASALHYAHQRGVIHRDLKPNNILLDEEENAYLTDFGIAKMLAATSGAHSLTATGRVMGTPAYMAPEQWRSEPVDARTDIYALGVILFEMLMGNLPFQAETPFAMMYKHFDTPPPLPRIINPDLPDQVEVILTRALAKHPGQRYPSAEALAEHFSQMVRALPSEQLRRALPRATAQQIEAATPSASASEQHEATEPISVVRRIPGTPMKPQVRDPRDTPTALVGEGNRVSSGAVTPVHGQAAVRPSRGRARWLAGVLVLFAALLGIAGLLASGLIPLGGDGETAATNTSPAVPSPTGPTRTPGPDDATRSAIRTLVAALEGLLPGGTFTPPITPDLEATADALAALRLTGTAQQWTATPTPRATLLPTATLPINHTATYQAQVGAQQTATARSWTATPTPNIEQTVIAAFTRTAQAWTPTASPDGACVLAARLAIKAGGRVIPLSLYASPVRSAPNAAAAVLRTLPAGTTFEVLAGPQCSDGMYWWQIEGISTQGTLWYGWVAEGAEGEYWLEPFESGPPACPGAPVPRLTPGSTGRITLDPPLASRVRSLPSTSGEVVGQLQPGETFTVLSGPVCDTANRWRWWLVSNERIEGWVAEGPEGEYWMEPQ